jgi:ferredoxin
MKKVIIHKDNCISCGTCAVICPEFFKVDDDTVEFVRDLKTDEDWKKITPDEWQKIEEAVASCPNGTLEIVDE